MLWITFFMLILLIGVIVFRRVYQIIKSHTRRNLRDRIETLLYQLTENEITSEDIVKWLKRDPYTRVYMLVKSIESVENFVLKDIGNHVSSNDLKEFFKKSLLNSRNRWTRAQVAWAVGELGFEDNLEDLKKALEDPSDDVAYAAAQALSNIDNEEGAFILSRQIGSDTRFQNDRIATILEQMSIDLRGVVREMIESDDNERIVWGINLVGSQELFDLVSELESFKQHPDPEVRSALAEVLGQLQVPLTDRWLEPLLRDDVWFVRSHASKAAGKLEAEWAVEYLVDMLTSQKWWLRNNSTEALIQIGEPGIDPVEDVLLHSDDQFARNCAARVLEKSGWVERKINQATSGQQSSLETLHLFASLGGIGSLENILMDASPAQIPLLLDLLETYGDDATFGRIRAAAENMPEDLREKALTSARSIRK